MGEQTEGQGLLVARHLLTGNLGVNEQAGKQLAKLHVMRALAKLPRLIHTPIKDHDVRIAAQQGL